MKHFLTLLLISISLIGFALMSGCATFTEPAFTEREYFGDGTAGDLSWAMNQAYANPEIYGFNRDGICDKRSRYAYSLLPADDYYLTTMNLKRDIVPIGKRGHMVLCRKLDRMCVDSTGIIADRYTIFPDSDLVYHAYDIKTL